MRNIYKYMNEEFFISVIFEKKNKNYTVQYKTRTDTKDSFTIFKSEKPDFKLF